MVPLAIMAFVFFLTEGAIYDWSGVFLRTELGVDLAAASIGYAAFSLLMASIRFCGDFWVARFRAAGGLYCRHGSRRSGIDAGLSGGKLPGFRDRLRLGRGRIGELCSAYLFGCGAAERSGLWRGIAAVASAGYFGFVRRTADHRLDCPS